MPRIKDLTIDRPRMRKVRAERDAAINEKFNSLEQLKHTELFWFDPVNIGSVADIAEFEAKFGGIEAQIPLESRFVIGDHVFETVAVSTPGETVVTGWTGMSVLDKGHCTTVKSSLETVMRTYQRDLQEALDTYQIDDDAVYVNMEVFLALKGAAEDEQDFEIGDRVIIDQVPYEFVAKGTAGEVLIPNYSAKSLLEVVA